MKRPPFYFVFDVESVGLHGEGFAVAGGIYTPRGACQREFAYACPPAEAKGDDDDRLWVAQNVPMMEVTHRLPVLVRDAFWKEWIDAKAQYPGIVMAAECLWPVEAKFVAYCIKGNPGQRKWEGPYPFLEISSVMVAAGMDPMGDYDREPGELPKHNPLADARQSARLLARALSEIDGNAKQPQPVGSGN